MLRVRRQFVKIGRKTSVEIISLDQFTLFARSIDRTKSERAHLSSLLAAEPAKGEPYGVYKVDDFCFWLEKE